MDMRLSSLEKRYNKAIIDYEHLRPPLRCLEKAYSGTRLMLIEKTSKFVLPLARPVWGCKDTSST